MRTRSISVLSLLVLSLAACVPSSPTASADAGRRLGATTNGAQLAAGKVLQIKEAHLTTDATPSAGSYTDVAGVTTTITTTAGNFLRIDASAQCIASSSTGALLGYKVVVGGVDAPHGTFFAVGNLGGVAVGANDAVLISTTPGPKTVKLQWNSVIGTGPSCHGSTVSATEFVQLVVSEVSL